MASGPRCVVVTAAFLWGGGFIIGSIGIATHQLWLVYLGYGALGGCGLGLGYVSPVSTLLRGFPDKRGMATSIGVIGVAKTMMVDIFGSTLPTIATATLPVLLY
jgi:hypothetical protein